jgi:hypothetical protein
LVVVGVRQHALAFAVVAAVAIAAGLFLTVWRPRYEPGTRAVPPFLLPYSRAEFGAGDAKRAFAAVGVRLVPKSRIPGVVTTIGTRDDAFEVDVFGDPAHVRAQSSPDVVTDSAGRYVRIPTTCTRGIPDAARWRGNVRFVVRCADAAHARLLVVGTRALAKL